MHTCTCMLTRCGRAEPWSNRQEVYGACCQPRLPMYPAIPGQAWSNESAQIVAEGGGEIPCMRHRVWMQARGRAQKLNAEKLGMRVAMQAVCEGVPGWCVPQGWYRGGSLAVEISWLVLKYSLAVHAPALRRAALSGMSCNHV